MPVDEPGKCCKTCQQTSCVFEVPGYPTPVVLKVSNSTMQRTSEGFLLLAVSYLY